MEHRPVHRESVSHRRTHPWVCAWIIVCLGILTAVEAYAEGSYSAGKTRLSASGGAGAGGFGLGLDVGHFVLDGLELSAGAAYLNANDWEVLQLTPGLRYIIDLEPLAPYLGGFLRRWEILSDDRSAFWSAGTRAGVYFSGGQVLLGLGAAREVLLDCPEDIDDCVSIYPEITFAFTL